MKIVIALYNHVVLVQIVRLYHFASVLADFKSEQVKVHELEEKLKALEEQRLEQLEESQSSHQDEISALKAKHEEEVTELKQQVDLAQREKQEKRKNTRS